MKNITITLDEETARWARIEAAHRDMSVSRLIGELLHQHMRAQTARLSFQVLQEYYAATTRKLKPGLSPEAARADVRDLLAWRPVPVGAEVLESSWLIEDRFGLSCWDALIVAAARIAGCEHLLTEDLQHGSDMDGLRVVNPFRTPPGSLD